MTLDKAIKIKELYYVGGDIPNHSDYREADKLSIEAMKREVEQRDFWHDAPLQLLPGETED